MEGGAGEWGLGEIVSCKPSKGVCGDEFKGLGAKGGYLADTQGSPRGVALGLEGAGLSLFPGGLGDARLISAASAL